MTGNDVNSNLTILSDPSMRVWKLPARINAINAAVRDIAANKPKATTVVGNLLLAAGVTRQAVPADVIEVLDLTCNMGPAPGNTPGRVITTVSAERLQASVPGWRRDKGAAVKHLVVDDRDPSSFNVWPAPLTAMYVEGLLQKHPATIAALADTLPIDQSYLNAVIEYTLHMLYAQEAENEEHGALSAAHYNKYVNLMGLQAVKQKRASAPANSAENPAYPVVDKNGA